MLVDMIKTLMKSKNILLIMKEHNENKVTTIKQVYNATNQIEVIKLKCNN